MFLKDTDFCRYIWGNLSCCVWLNETKKTFMPLVTADWKQLVLFALILLAAGAQERRPDGFEY